jgi:hypothetical protein
MAIDGMSKDVRTIEELFTALTTDETGKVYVIAKNLEISNENCNHELIVS